MYQLLIFIILLSNTNCLPNKPTIEELFASPILVEGKKFSLTCQVSDELNSLEWLFNGNKIIANENVTISQPDEDQSILIIKSMSLNYAGDYTCKIKNSLGEDSRSITVKLNGMMSHH